MSIDRVDFYSEEDQALAMMHIGMFLAWALLRGHGSTEWMEDLAPLVAQRAGRPSALASSIDGKLGDEDFDETMAVFARSYYGEQYFDDFDDAVTSKAGLFSPADSWKSFDRLVPLLDRRFAESN